MIQSEHLQRERRAAWDVVDLARVNNRRELARRRIQDATAEALEASGDRDLRRRAAAMRACCSAYAVMTHDGDPTKTRVVPVNRCWDRLCPSEAAHRAHAWMERLRPRIEEAKQAGDDVRYFVLPQRTRPGESLVEARRRFETAFRRLTQSQRFKKHVRAWMASREMTWSNGAWNYHANVLYVGDFWPQAELSEAWRWATDGESYIVHIQRAYDGVELEAVKYALKIAKLPAEQLVEYATSMRGARLISTGGAWYGIAPPEAEDASKGEAGWRIVPFEELFARARQGEVWALERLDVVARWIEERAGPEAGARFHGIYMRGVRDGPTLEAE